MDVRLLFIINTLTLLITLIVLITNHIKDTQNKSIKFLTYFIALHFIGFILFVLRNQIPDFFSIIVANMLFAIGVVYLYMAIRSILKKEYIWHNRYFIPILIYFIGFVMFTYISYDTQTRILIYYTFCTMFVFPSGWLLWSAQSEKFKVFDKASAIVFFIIALIFTAIIFQATIIRIETYYFSNKNIFMILSLIIVDIMSLWALLALRYRIKT